MELQSRRFVANQMVISPGVLKEVPNNMRRELYSMYDRQSAIIIDYGSQTIKAGYDMNQDGPCLIFRPQISKTRDPNKTDIPIKQAINLSYDQLDLSKANFKSAFQKNIILHFSILEQCNDYIFSQIVRPNKPIGSPLIISEPFANPIHCRTSILEQFFQCYQVREVMVGVDALFAYFYQVDCNIDRYQRETSLVISMGANTVHVFCMINGKPDFSSVRRINVGGNNAFEIFGRTLILKNPQLKNKLTYTFLRDIYEKFTEIAEDYRQQLRYMQKKETGKKSIYEPENPEIYHNRIHERNKKEEEDLINFIEGIEIDFDVIVEIPEEELRRKEEIKLRMAEKLRETIERRKEIKKKLHENQLAQLQDLLDKYEKGDKQAHEEAAEMFGSSKIHDKILKKIHSIQVKLGLVEEKPSQNKFSLIDTPDHELPADKLKLKRMQVYQKNMIEARQRKNEEKKLEEQRMRDLRENNPQVYLQQLREKYKSLSDKIKQNERIKNQLNNRKSRLKQRQMQVLVRLAEEDFDENMENEQDAPKDAQDSDHFSELQVMEAELRDIDPEWGSQNKDIHHLNSNNQLFLHTDLIKCHEIYFQPRIAGCNQAGLTETILSSIYQYSDEIKKNLLGNILVIGGGSQIKGLKERITRDLTQETPSGSNIKVKIGKGGLKGAFLGMQNICHHHREYFSKFAYQRDLFLENPMTYYVQNSWSNPKPNLQ